MKNKVLKLTSLFAFSAIVFSACAEKKEAKTVAAVVATTTEKAVEKVVSQEKENGLVSTSELTNMLNPELLLIDVRTPEEFNSGHIEGAVNINFYDEDFAERVKALDQEKNIVVYCAVGGRSGKAYRKVKEMGFKNHYDLAGGIKAWNADSLPLEQ